MTGAQALPHCKYKEEGEERGWGSKSPQEKRQREEEGFGCSLQQCVCTWVWSQLERGPHLVVGAKAVGRGDSSYSGWGLISHNEVMGTGSVGDWLCPL